MDDPKSSPEPIPDSLFGRMAFSRTFFRELAALEATGWRLVGPEPTEAMIERGSANDVLPIRWDDPREESRSSDIAADIWRAMLAAAPTYGDRYG